MIILHVDDDSDDREVLKEALKEINPEIDCIQAKNGIEGFDILTKGILYKKINCVFLDINMPLMDGIALLALIKGDKRLSRIPVHVYSTTSDEREIAYVKKLGGNFIHKTTQYNKLVKSLKGILQNVDC
ncbi:MAG TPA: response regulator [Chryseosolibacter sp.]